jgi:signal transduction histidine kinase
MDRTRIALLKRHPEAMLDFWRVYDAHYAEISRESVAALEAFPQLTSVIEQMRTMQDPETAVQRQEESRELLRRAMVDGEWAAYLAHTRQMGAGYARADLTFDVWSAAIASIRPLMVERLLKAYGSDPKRFAAATNAMGHFLDAALAVIGDEYMKVREEIIREVTADAEAHRKAEERIQALNEELQREVAERTVSNRELEAFSYTVSHDLRAPLRAINGFVEAMVEDHRDELSEDARVYLDDIADNARQMAQLIEDLLAFSRLSRKLPRLVRVNPTAIAKAALETVERATEPSSPVKVKIDRMPAARADPALLGQVYVNLLGNAIKFSRNQPRPEVTVGHQNGGGPTTYFVKDNGVGFDPAYADKLFGVFQRLHAADEFEGTGVGLAIVQRIVHRHGGRVWAESKPGEGAAFFFTLGEQPVAG